MMKYIFLVLCYISLIDKLNAQLSTGPVIGHSTDSSVIVWYQYYYNLKDSIFLIPKSGSAKLKPDTIERWKTRKIITIKAYFNKLKPGENYFISFPYITFKKYKLFRPDYIKKDFSFLLGSCILTLPMPAKTVYPGRRIEIFNSMKRDFSNDFMLWTGDYVYYLKFHLKSKNGMFNRMNNQRAMFPEINDFQRSIINYAMWDDHDYGPNNSEGNFKLKAKSRQVFEMQWPNPKRERESRDSGIYFKFDYKDINVFMMDCRYNKLSIDTPKHLWGKEQMSWLKRNLLVAKGSFKFISNGGQILTKSRVNSPESFYYFKEEYDELMQFIKVEKIEGVIFLSGDIHSSEILKVDQGNGYPLYEYTCSALTSVMYAGINNKEVIPGYREAKTNNYGKISIKTENGNRLCILSNFDTWGNLNWEYKIKAKDLTFKK